MATCHHPVGIIGSACRFPGAADSPAKLWELLRNPKDVLCTFPPQRLNMHSFYHSNGEHHGSTDVQSKGYLLKEDIRLFDASFFHISPPEAAAMDPQQRILLETVYEALESAGLPLDQLQGSLTSVWAGLMNADFADIQTRDLDLLPKQHATGTHRSILSNRISYFLDTNGPSMTIDTACSSSLVALHQGVQSLRSGESDMAIIAGANLILDPAMYVAESKLHMLSPESRSRMWDKSANGYARGEGFAAVVLQRLGDAVRNGSHVECLIRGTAVNSDGRGKGGITVPSAAAQTALILQAYRDAGLDARRDRCHYFEAHGTGTQAGDPVEAQAIRDAFFPPQNAGRDLENPEVPPGKLLVGSIKTVIGHLEGTAGLAGVLKASLAIQNRMIPPNMLFSELNPTVAPFYDRLEIPTGQARQWPQVTPGSPLRASVNSFGFGGTNAHVILESYQNSEQQRHPTREDHSEEQSFVGPLLFSAKSRASLVRSVQAHAEALRSDARMDLGDLAWTLQRRRTHFGNNRVSFSGSTRQKLLSQMDEFLAGATATTATTATTPADPLECPALLGIFTGQGAQWASMGRGLIRHSRVFRESVERCEKSLAELGADAPSWSLMEELVAEDTTSRVAEATIAQPLCTAVQIGLVDLLRASGVRFRAVVGHSSGEIAAAYAAGIVPRAGDAIRIAYYRGLHSRLATGSGAMLAVGLSWDEAETLCARPEYDGHAVVAAVNSPTSSTLSGDAGVLERVEAELRAGGTFARKLKVNMAYHSHHMDACAPAYLASIRRCNIQVQQPPDGCVWVSSVRGDVDAVLANDDDGSGLPTVRDQYWVDNLTNPVLFAPAVGCSLWRGGPFDAVIEVGPHPALKGPVTDILKTSLGASLPYAGVMQRQRDEVEAFSGSLGYLWEQFGSAASIDFDGYRQAFSALDAPRPRLVKGLPAYSWDHEKVHWMESRLSRNFRLGDRPIHGLLGRRAPDDTPSLMRWRNVFRLSEMSWVKGHVFQGQVVLPGTAYVSAVTEAVKVLAGASSVKVVDLLDVVLHKAVVLGERGTCEFTTNMRLLHRSSHLLSAEFFFTVVQSDSDAAPDTTCSGRVDVHFEEEEEEEEEGESLLPSLLQAPPNLCAIDVDLFYSSLKNLGLAFNRPFRGTKTAQRALGYASTSASWDEEDGDMSLGTHDEPCSLHPAVLDTALHALFAAFASPNTNQMWTPYLPVAIRRASIVLRDCPGTGSAMSSPHSPGSPSIEAHVFAQITASSPKRFEGDVQVRFGDSNRVAVQVEGVTMRAMADQAGPLDDDTVLFSTTRWVADIANGVDNVLPVEGASEQEHSHDDSVIEGMGRTALYYYRRLLEQLSTSQIQNAAWHHQMYVESAQHWVDEVRAGRHPTIKREWLQDREDMIRRIRDKFPRSIDIMLMNAVGESLVPIIQGEKQPLEVMIDNDMLTRFYVEGHGLHLMNDHIARAVSQIVHRYPRANILEIGAGTGGTTRSVLRVIGNTFGHYTFTDVSPGFFERAAERFSDQIRRRNMTFHVLDIERDVIDQGFSEGTYDVIVAANVLHATEHLEATLQQVRRLLKPGGYLVMMEITGDLMRLGFILGVLSGWWLGPRIGDEGRKWAPGISTPQWHDLLRRTGFSGVDSTASDNPVAENHYLSTLVTQAVNHRVEQLRSPLSHLATVPAPYDVAKLLIIGGKTPAVSRLARDVELNLASWAGVTIEIVSGVDEVDLDPDEHVSAISLTELEEPLFGSDNLMTAARLERLQVFLQRAGSILWANMFQGLARAVRAEQRDINLQLLDVGSQPDDADSFHIASAFVRLALSGQRGPLGTMDREPVLWTTESELALDAGTLLIPRLVPDEARNQRYRAARRIVTKQIDSESIPHWDLEAEYTEDGTMLLAGLEHTLTRRLAWSRASNSIPQVQMHVQLSTALLLPEHQRYLCYGSVAGSPAFAITPSSGSVVLVDTSETIPFLYGDSESKSPAISQASKILEALAGQVVARSLIQRVPRRGPVLLHEPPEKLARAIAGCRLWRDRQLYYTSSSSLPDSTVVPKGWIVVSDYETSSSIRQKLPDNIAAIVDFSALRPGTRLNLGSLLPAGSVKIQFEPAFLDTDSGTLTDAYADAMILIHSQATTGEDHRNTQLIPRNTIPGLPSSYLSYPSILTVHVKPLDASGIFSSTKTHLMVGLNGDLGQSICGYVAENGARHIAITSRGGEVNPEWLEAMQRQGVNVKVYAMDVTNRHDIRATVEQMRSDGMPPIAGVSNGALVLRDKLFLNMDADGLNETLQPKVHGSQNLNDLFSEHLDYFVLFSSLATVAGNAGQSNYHAANMFMAGLVTNRRARGLAASVMHVGVVADAGYVTRQGRQLLEHLRKQFFMGISESDAHQLFAEAVLASPADSGLAFDICMGLEPFPDRPGDADLRRPPWVHDPRLSHFVLVQPDENQQALRQMGGHVDGQAGASLKQEMDAASNLQGAEEALQDGFLAKLRAMLQLNIGSINVHAPLLELGFDSLLAVETRTWFQREVSVDIPVLRFLGDNTIHQICIDAAAKYLASRSADIPDAAPGPGSDLGSATISDSSAPSTTTPRPGNNEDGGNSASPAPKMHNLPKEKWGRDVYQVEKLSFAQARLWRLGQALDDSTASNIGVAFTIKGLMRTG
ncbi:hypothetical protein B0I35DRAFT_471642 [Stachybotrys elegans]|uniref:Carrier domain-containing protein n=1 Tax=Stachybotrys elegans TaxID=80388 RepID=A0A8K0SBH4_9HYPO|nr:hypothetical protein B0I35DRAFT_471642 [Stachybotrys elegans]